MKQGKMVKLSMIGLAFISVLALPACVTINIYFPAAAAEKAADKIIDEVWQIKKGEKAESPSESSEVPAEKQQNNPKNKRIENAKN